MEIDNEITVLVKTDYDALQKNYMKKILKSKKNI